VVEVKDANGIHDCAQARDLLNLDPVSLAVAVQSRGGNYDLFFSCPEGITDSIREGLDDCGCPSIPVAEVHDDGIHLLQGNAPRPLANAAGPVLHFPWDQLVKIPAELLRFSPEAELPEIAQWVMIELIALAERESGPFQVVELSELAAGRVWNLMNQNDRQGVTSKVQQVLVDAGLHHLNSYIHALGRAGGHWQFNYEAVWNPRTGEPREAFQNACTYYAGWRLNSNIPANYVQLPGDR
jgi:hypothetical protein